MKLVCMLLAGAGLVAANGTRPKGWSSIWKMPVSTTVSARNVDGPFFHSEEVDR